MHLRLDTNGRTSHVDRSAMHLARAIHHSSAAVAAVAAAVSAALHPWRGVSNNVAKLGEHILNVSTPEANVSLPP